MNKHFGVDVDMDKHMDMNMEMETLMTSVGDGGRVRKRCKRGQEGSIDAGRHKPGAMSRCAM